MTELGTECVSVILTSQFIIVNQMHKNFAEIH